MLGAAPAKTMLGTTRQVSSQSPVKRRRTSLPQAASSTKAHQSSPPLTPPENDDDTGSSNRSHSDVESDHCKSEHFYDRDLDAASSLANLFSASSSGYAKTPPSQPMSAPTVMSSPMYSKSGSYDVSATQDPNQKRQRRREKNRCSAQQSRQRKKFHLEALEQRVDALETERKSLMTKVNDLAKENESLKLKLGVFSSSSKSSDMAPPTFSSPPSAVLPPSLAAVAKAETTTMATTAAAAAATTTATTVANTLSLSDEESVGVDVLTHLAQTAHALSSSSSSSTRKHR